LQARSVTARAGIKVQGIPKDIQWRTLCERHSRGRALQWQCDLP